MVDLPVWVGNSSMTIQTAGPNDEAPPVSVAVADDYELVVRGVGALVAGDPRLRVVELAAGEPVTKPVDVVLFDTFGCGEPIEDAVATILGDQSVGALVVYTDVVHHDAIRRALGAGASGVVAKRASGAELAEAVLRAHRGETVVQDGAGQAGDTDRAWPGKAEGLTERESEVLSLVVQGRANQDIADLLYINVNTVKGRLKSVYRKIDVDNRVRAAIWGFRHGFEPREPVHYGR